ncbi:AMP-dependent synthetase/ligase [Penicillium macrosclerotiorum]|uniref:AMP-dependent synthetase/ligase n=1 Tax=Penicillium macrosclerotiorum TaxID=303699 RepID=UPI0025472A5E|nr:AMP-dependent synthetase/ligase [Penicillium macrosclerotiorum]KAJ5675485.1 AMP-dependent synthetase/ligase [Penicillium macrosclerotiorum]
MAYGRVLSQFTGRSRPTFFFNHSSRFLETFNGDETIDLTNMSVPTMTVTPLTVEIETSSTKLSLQAHLNIIYSEGDDTQEMNPNPMEKNVILQRHKLEEPPLASHHFTKTEPSSSSSTIDNLDTSSIHGEQLYFNVLVFPGGYRKLTVSGDEELSHGQQALATRLMSSFVSQLLDLIET